MQIIYNENELYNFIFIYIKNNKNLLKLNILHAYDLLTNDVNKSELFRYFYLYINGGCYFDYSMTLLKSLSDIIQKDDNIILLTDNNIICNSVIMIEKHNENMYKCIEECVNNILNKIKGNSFECITGNIIFNKYFNDTDIKLLQKNDNFTYYNNLKIIKNVYTNYVHNIDVNKLFNDNEVFYNYYDKILDYKFFIYPYNFNDKFQILSLKNNIFLIKRIDIESGWGQNIKIKIIDVVKNIIYLKEIGSSEDNEKIFFIE